MNIRDRDAVYAEFRRVLRPRGKVAFYDVVAADDKPRIHLPVPWSASPETNFLLTEHETRAAFERAGFTIDSWNDVSDGVLAWFAAPQAGPTSFRLIDLLGPRLAEMTRNFALDLREARIRVVSGIANLT